VHDDASDRPPIRLVVGLGNPGTRYAGTRHNAGQMALEELARRLGAGRFTERFAGKVAEVRGPRGPLTLLVPTTYMNESGRSAGPAAGSLRITPAQVLVLHDEIDLPFGQVRGKTGGGHGGHNGLRSLDTGLGGRDYRRIRIGVGRPPEEWRGDAASWVLSAFREPADEVDALVSRAADMAEVALADGLEAAVARFHAGTPGQRSRRRAERRAGRPAGGDAAGAVPAGEAADEQ
jgi:PTH1 family peptidyl-tRNA hydrolase